MTPLSAVAAELLDAKPRMAVVSAFEPEWQALKSELSDASEHQRQRPQLHHRKLAGKDVVLFLSGVSMVNAAMNTQIALDPFLAHLRRLLRHRRRRRPDLDIGDVVIADQWGQYLEAVFARETLKVLPSRHGCRSKVLRATA